MQSHLFSPLCLLKQMDCWVQINYFLWLVVSNKTTVFCNETGQYTIYPSDRFGFNNPDTEWSSPKVEWVLVGDSFTHGACVRPGEDIGGQIRLITREYT